MNLQEINELALDALDLDSTYSHQKVKVAVLRFALENAYNLGKLDAIEAYEGLDYAREPELHITKAGYEALADSSGGSPHQNAISDLESLLESSGRGIMVDPEGSR